MSEYYVIWEADAGVIQSFVETEALVIHSKAWVRLAAESEGMSPEEIEEMLDEPGGWSLYAVMKGQVNFVY